MDPVRLEFHPVMYANDTRPGCKLQVPACITFIAPPPAGWRHLPGTIGKHRSADYSQ